MTAEIISIGDELLIGKTINTNAAWIGAQLALINIQVKWCQTISDDREAIRSSVDVAFGRSDLIIVTGGLGPTKDDITKHELAAYFETELVIHEEVLARITDFFTKRGRPMLEVNRLQAALPASCEVIPNYQGTASGMWFERNGKVLISLPGVPYEMKGMMHQELLPKIASHFAVKQLYHRTILTVGIGESFLADQMQDWESRILADGFGMAYLPSPGMVKLRITSYSGEQDAHKITAYLDELKTRMPQYVYGYEQETLSGVVGAMLRERGKTLGSVESCTGGSLAAEIVSVAGASDYYHGSLITYKTELKRELAGVAPILIEKYGVVSQECAEAMAAGGRQKLGVDYCLATTGVAGPDPDGDIAAGTIWIAVSGPEGIRSRCLNLGDNRERNIEMTVLSALNLLRWQLLSI